MNCGPLPPFLIPNSSFLIAFIPPQKAWSSLREISPMDPHARSATALCRSHSAEWGVLWVWSLARMRYGSPVMPWIGWYYAFCVLVTRDWWRVTRKSFIAYHLSVCRNIIGYGSCTISSSHANRGFEVYKRDGSFLHLPDAFKGIRVSSSFDEFRNCSFELGLHVPLSINTENWGKKRTFSR